MVEKMEDKDIHRHDIVVLLSKEKVNSLLTINYRASRDPTRRQGSTKKLKNY